MPRGKRELPVFENLDLFAAQTTTEPAPTLAQVIAAEEQASEPGPLFLIGPEDQLDLFRHSPAEIAAAETRRAFKDLDAPRARSHLSLLRPMPAWAGFVADSDRCLQLIERTDPRWDDAALAVPWIEAELWPAAIRCLQRDTMLLLRPALLAVLERSEARPFAADCRHAHPSYLWQLLGQPAHAVAALELDPHWREQPAALLWHASLSEQAELHERVHADVAELCFTCADAAESWLSASRAWAARWNAWCDLDDALPLHAFPAWCRLTRSSEFPLPDANDPRPGAKLLRIAHQLAGSASDLMLRKTLNAQCPALLATFLAARKAQNG